jgi:hypothetical protein
MVENAASHSSTTGQHRGNWRQTALRSAAVGRRAIFDVNGFVAVDAYE